MGPPPPYPSPRFAQAAVPSPQRSRPFAGGTNRCPEGAEGAAPTQQTPRSGAVAGTGYLVLGPRVLSQYPVLGTQYRRKRSDRLGGVRRSRKVRFSPQEPHPRCGDVGGSPAKPGGGRFPGARSGAVAVPSTQESPSRRDVSRYDTTPDSVRFSGRVTSMDGSSGRSTSMVMWNRRSPVSPKIGPS